MLKTRPSNEFSSCLNQLVEYMIELSNKWLGQVVEGHAERDMHRISYMRMGKMGKSYNDINSLKEP